MPQSVRKSPLLWAALALFVALVGALSVYIRRDPPPLPVLGQLPPFELTNHEGQPYGLEQLKGRVSVVDFIFTSCPDVCPLLTQQMSKLQSRARDLKVPVNIVSISVDPDTDKPAVLKAYALKYGVNLANWAFLTGPLAKIENVIIEGFKVGLENKSGATDLFDVTHSEHFVIVDGLGRIRSYRRAANNSEIDSILSEVRSLEHEATSTVSVR